jgi:hypothetical protein
MLEDSLNISRDTRFTETIKQDVYSLMEEYDKILIEYPEDSDK